MGAFCLLVGLVLNQQVSDSFWPDIEAGGMCGQVSSRLTSGAEALKTSGEMRSMSLRQSISGALQRVSGIRSPSGGAPEPGESAGHLIPRLSALLSAGR